MSQTNFQTQSIPAGAAISDLTALILAIPPASRGAALHCAASFRPETTLDESLAIGPLRAAFANYWEVKCCLPVPIAGLRSVLEPPVPIGTVLEFSKLTLTQENTDIQLAVNSLVQHLQQRLRELDAPMQLGLFEADQQSLLSVRNSQPVGSTVTDLQELVEQGANYPTIVADPPWRYDNEASRAAAVNHYPTMSVSEVCAEPVAKLADQDAHLHLWTTNAFLREAYDVIDAWGFQYKSCLVWVKDELGMGNYWRVSHELLLLGVRGKLPFRDRTVRSWVQAHRTVHSRKPGIIRELIERVSPGPYLELYGREELPNSAWTVYGNQIERRLF